MKYFVDTSAWVAYFDKADKFHHLAGLFLIKKPYLVTSNIVIHETIALLHSRINKRVAQEAGEFLFDSQIVELVVATEAVELASWKEYKRQGVGISFVDYSNKVIMTNEGLDTIFSFDDDFKKFKLKIVP